MRRALFAGWLVVMGGLLLALADSAFPGSVRALLGAFGVWALGVVPVSFRLWFRAQHEREEEDVAAALEAFRRQAPDAVARLEVAVREALSEEDEAAVKQLLPALEAAGRFQAFVPAARRWLSEEGARERRVERLEEARVQLEAGR